MAIRVQARRYVVSGLVQGVGFRWFVREQARARGLAGFVLNTSDGLVVAEVRGNADRLSDSVSKPCLTVARSLAAVLGLVGTDVHRILA